MLSHFVFNKKYIFFNNIWCVVMTIYACHIPLVNHINIYDMNVVHGKRHNMYTLSIKKIYIVLI